MGDRYSEYWHQVIPDSRRDTGLQEVEIPNVRDYFIEQILRDANVALDSKTTNLRLLSLVNGDFNSRAAQCLRCYISHQIKKTCESLTRKHGSMSNFKSKDIFPYALEDFIQERRDVPLKLLAIKILSTFNPSSGTELSTWTDRRVRWHKPIVDFLEDHGISDSTDWGLLDDAKIRDLENATTFLQVRLEEAKRLLTCFHNVYREDRRRNLKKGKCEPPTSEQLQEMCNLLSLPSSESLELTHESLQSKLELIAKGLRNWKMGGKRVSSEEAYNLHKSKIDGTRVTGERGEVVNEVDKFEQQEIFSADEDWDELLGENENGWDIFLREIERVTRIKIDRRYEYYRKRKDGKPAEYLQALHLHFDRGMNQTEIAVELGWERQDQVSRLLNLPKLRTDIVDGVFNSLRSKNLIPSDSNENDGGFESIQELIRKYLDRKTLVENRSQTVMSQAICKYLQSRGQG